MLRIVSAGRPRLPPVTSTPIEKTDANTRAVYGDLGGVPNTCQFVSLSMDVRSRELQSQALHHPVAPVYNLRCRAVWSFPSTTSSALSEIPAGLLEQAVKPMLKQAELLCADWAR
jgi:hypothetical protein